MRRNMGKLASSLFAQQWIGAFLLCRPAVQLGAGQASAAVIQLGDTGVGVHS
jgi:hypothetical protein